MPISILEACEESPTLKKALEIIYAEVLRLSKSKEEAAKLLMEISGSDPAKPRGWSKSSNAPYYKKEYGEFVISLIEDLLKIKPKDLAVNSGKLHIAKVSLKQCIIQGWLWLIEFHENKEIYRELRDKIEILSSSSGVILSWKTETRDAEVMKQKIETEAVDKRPLGQWKKEVLDFIEDTEKKDNDKLLILNLRLEPFDLEWVNAIFNSCPGMFIKKVNASKIEVIYNLELWNKMQES